MREVSTFDGAMIYPPIRIKTTEAVKLQDEYAKLVEGLQEAVDDTDGFMANPGKRLTRSIP